MSSFAKRLDAIGVLEYKNEGPRCCSHILMIVAVAVLVVVLVLVVIPPIVSHGGIFARDLGATSLSFTIVV